MLLLLFTTVVQTLGGSGNASANGNYPETEIDCSENFYFNMEYGLCLPVCGEWYYASKTVKETVDVITILSGVIHVVASSILLAVSCAQYKHM